MFVRRVTGRFVSLAIWARKSPTSTKGRDAAIAQISKHVASNKTSMAETTNSTWYVSFEIPRTEQMRGKGGRRTTATFPNELEAREFARTKLAEGLSVSAGTINPHLPKRTIASTQIHRWLGDM
jgi:hypothetical protein